MTKQAFQFFLAGCVSIVLAGCEGRVADSASESVEESGLIPTQRQDVQDVVIDETFLSSPASDSGESLGLYTFNAPETEGAVIDSSEVFFSDEGMTLSLDTSSENGAKPDLTILVSDDTVYKVDHHSNELKLVRHFKNEICEILAKEEVVSSVSGEGSSIVETFSVQHAESVYVLSLIHI